MYRKAYGNVSSGTALVSPYVTIPEGGKAGQSGCKYTAIVAPGAANPNSTFVSLNYKGEDLVLPGIPAIKAGFCYEFTLKVEGSVIRLSEPIVTPWETGTINGGDAIGRLLCERACYRECYRYGLG